MDSHRGPPVGGSILLPGSFGAQGTPDTLVDSDPGFPCPLTVIWLLAAYPIIFRAHLVQANVLHGVLSELIPTVATPSPSRWNSDDLPGTEILTTMKEKRGNPNCRYQGD
jgi:hypothetical protein